MIFQFDFNFYYYQMDLFQSLIHDFEIVYKYISIIGFDFFISFL